ncbi:Positive regulator of sigma(E), RseC/MucC [Candidatus Magnetoovum chiemensis]|nr:Positive regulator of sigma(E), RseC/MucC [Candidatus Magnetoovum chiemensis]
MEEIGKITAVEGITAKVAVERKSACDQCKEGFCIVSEDSAEIEALNPLYAQVGQKVRVVTKPYSYLKGTFIIYGLPVIALFFGAIAGKFYLIKYFNDIDSEVLSALGGVFALLISLIIVKLISRKLEKTTEYKPVIEEIIDQ